jgi:prepilin-type N-terminal cleavage/methylation domain-containing protein
MKRQVSSRAGFTITELVIASAIGSVLLAAILTASIALQRSFNGVDNYFATHMQQIRIVDYLSRDAKRAYVVTATASPQTVSCTVPNYIIKTGDADAGASNENVGKRRTPTVKKSATGFTVSYASRTVNDAATTSGSPTLTSTNAGFTSGDAGLAVSGAGIPIGTTISAYVNATTVTLSQNASATGSGVTATFGAASSVVYSISNQSILRTENGTLTTIASSTDNLLPSWLDVTLANTEYLTTSITFLPIFASGLSTTYQATERGGTTIYSTAYLRNKRRG